MAINRMDIIDVELNSGTVNRSFLMRSIGKGDNNANSFGVRLFRNGDPENIGFGAVQGFFRNSHGENIALTSHGTIEGNLAYVTLPQECYNYEGQFTLSIKIVSPESANTVTMRIIDGIVDNTNTDGAVAPTDAIPTYQEILAVYDEFVDALLENETNNNKIEARIAWTEFSYGKSIRDAVGNDLMNGIGIISGDYGHDEIAADNRIATPLLRINPGDTVIFKRAKGLTQTYYVNFYDKHTALISSFLKNTYNNTKVVAPGGTKYFRMSFSTADEADDVVIISRENADRIRNTDGFVDIEMYGKTDDLIITENGVTNDENERYSITSYIPVAPRGRLLFAYNLNSQYRGMEFRDDSLNLISFVPLNSGRYINVPEGATLARCTFFKDAADLKHLIYYMSPYTELDCINVRSFGAIGDSKTDDSDILQACFDIGGNVGLPVYIPAGRYLITKTLTVRRRNALIHGEKWSIYSGSRIIMKTFDQYVNESGAIEYPMDGDVQRVTGNPVTIGINIIESGVCIHDLILIPNYVPDNKVVRYDTYNQIATGINFAVPSMDVDARIENVRCIGCNKGISVTGRNPYFINDHFTHCNVGIEITWGQRYTGEQRGIVISGCRFHSCGRNTFNRQTAYNDDQCCIKFPDYAYSEYVDEIVVENNFADFCGVFIGGNIMGADIINNSVFKCRNAFIKAKAKTPVPNGMGTTIVGLDLFGGTLPEESEAVYVPTLKIATREGRKLTQPIPVQPGNLVYIHGTGNTRVWGHGLVDSNGELIDAILANADRYYIIPEGVAGIRVDVVERLLSESYIIIYPSYEDVDLETAQQNSIPITIFDNQIDAATETDYTPGLNIPEKLIDIKSFSNLIISNNGFENGTDDIIVLNNCEKIMVSENHFIESPSYCIYNIGTEEEPEEITVTGEGKSYIKYTDCRRIVIENNVAFGYRESDDSPFYVTNPVMNGNVPVEYSESNKFEHAEQ